ncbi:cholesterol 25-hydroxylase [Vombatus ursinus]|uniref:cholesterol 25-hydroxylase n=1 Tax=Vombatus ursinus TaxID=29139 RepID=UPI000FFDB96E|nr:cholesterol 25-hydroxylase [Vombatus ursinus]
MASLSMTNSSSELPGFRALDASTVRLLQPLWDMIKAREGLLQSPFFPVLFSGTTYVAFCLPFIVLDFVSYRVPALRKYKIHPHFYPSAGQVLLCLLHTVYQHVVFIFPVTVLRWHWGPQTWPAAAPGLWELLYHVTVCLLLFDAEYFVWHVLHHKVPWLYQTFHKVHHKNTSPFALATQYLSVWELSSLGFFDCLNPTLLGCHPLTTMTFNIVNIWLSVEDHCGYDFPWSTHRLVPYGWYGGVSHHDLHHRKINCNYAPYFTHWDKLLGTLSLGYSAGNPPTPAPWN